MEAVVVVVVALVVLDVLALRFGAESRDGFGGGGSGQRHASASGTGTASGGGSTMWSAYSVEQEAYLRHEENLRWAGRRRLLHEARQASLAAAGAGPGGERRRRRAPLHRRLLHRLGGRLVAWGDALQARMEAPELARALERGPAGAGG